MIGKHIASIEKDDIDALVADGVQEGRTLDYKAELPGSRDDDKREFLADVSSFANAAGGDMVFGVSEQKDDDGKNMGIPEQAVGLAGCNADQECLRLESVVRDGLEPRVAGIQIRAIEGFAAGPVMIVRVPRSWNGPHMVTFRNLSRFFARTSAGKYQLDVTEIRHAFAASADLGERLRNLRLERIGRIAAQDTPVPIAPVPAIIVHVVPLVSLEGTTAFTMQQLAEAAKDVCPMARGLLSGWGPRRNYDGLSIHSLGEDRMTALTYVQVFRSGIVEGVETQALRLSAERAGCKLMLATAIEDTIIEALSNFLSVPRALDLPPPYVLFVSFTGVRGYGIQGGAQFPGEGGTIDRDVLLLPEILVEESAPDVGKLLQSVFDMLWQACGYWRSPNYDESGERKSPR